MTDLIGSDLGLTEALSKTALVPTTDQPQKGKDFTSDQEVRWCPGCGDYVILNTIRNFLPELLTLARGCGRRLRRNGVGTHDGDGKDRQKGQQVPHCLFPPGKASLKRRTIPSVIASG